MAEDDAPVQARSRTIRDPIHGDIELTPLQAAIVDTRHFHHERSHYNGFIGVPAN